jgi:hypothetical protein
MQMTGIHNPAYWIQSIGHIMAIQNEVMQRALGQRPFGQPPATRRQRRGHRQVVRSARPCVALMFDKLRRALVNAAWELLHGEVEVD